ncbi:hypothetical protein D3C77_394280 [compost metagenome]
MVDILAAHQFSRFANRRRMGQRLPFILIAKISMSIDMNHGQIRIFLVHRLDDWPADQMLSAQTDGELMICQQTANIIANDIKTASGVAKRQQQIPRVKINGIQNILI